MWGRFEHDYLLDALAATPAILRGLLTGAEAGRPAGDEGWTAREVVAHLRDAEEFSLSRYHKMASEEEPSLAAYDQEALAHERKYSETDLAAAIDSYEQGRGRSVNLLKSLRDVDWQRSGRHEERGTITIEQLATTNLYHDIVHLRQITESLGRTTA